jgi:hypothetical protein
VVDNNGTIDVLWIDKFDGYKFVMSADGGATWTAPVTVKYPFSVKALPPVILADTKGFIHIFWLSDKNDLSYAQTLANGVGTPSLWRVRRLASSVYDFDIHLDVEGVLHLGYVTNPAPNPGIAGVFYQHSSDGGSSWSAPTQLYESSYFRSLTPDQARIRISTSDNPDGKNVYVVWDDQPQKRIFMATSADSGITWNPAQELITPQANLGFKTPYHANVNVSQNKLLVTWQVGDPGTRCTPYSWMSTDGGKTWHTPIRILADATGCPESSDFISVDPAYPIILFTIQGTISLSAWNGSQWSSPEVQTGPASITDPATFDPVILGNERTAIYKNQFYVVGSGQGLNGDVWFIARQLDAISNLFPLSSAWSNDTNLAVVTQTITSLSSITDDAGNIHAFWVQSSGTTLEPTEPKIVYARWNGTEWTNPVSILTDLSSLPLNLSLQVDNKNHRLLLSWVSQSTGDLFFTWANSERSNIPQEWVAPVSLASPSPLTSSPAILVDASSRIVIAYAITLNEERGIYIIQSTDLGDTWSAPVRVFDAVSANWQMVDQPQLAVTEDGKLHILFTKYTLSGGKRPLGTFYSRSSDGGTSWTEPEAVSEQSVQWSDMVAFKETLHRFWQEKNRSVVTTYHQVSADGGTTWEPPLTLPNNAGAISNPSVSLDWTGKLHLLQMAQTDTGNLQELEWNTKNWQLSTTQKLDIPKQDSQIVLTSGITSQGNLYTIFEFEDASDISSKTNVFGLSRSLEESTEFQPFLSSISIPSASSLSTPTSSLQDTPTVPASLVNLQTNQSSLKKNIVGLLLVFVIVFLLFIITITNGRKDTSKAKQTK